MPAPRQIATADISALPSIPNSPGMALRSGIIPEVHLKQFSRARIPTITVCGDSTYTQAADGISQALYAYSEIIRRIRECNPTRNITAINRAIPGTSSNQLTATLQSIQDGGATIPSWGSPLSAAWNSFLQNTAPDLLIVGHGMNGGSTWSPTTIESFVTLTLGWAKVPDLVWATSLVPSLNSDLGTAAEQDARDQAAGWVRTWTQTKGYGLLDFHRVMRAVRDGIDVTDTEAKTVTEVYNGPLPYTYGGEKLYDFRIKGTFVGTRATLLAGGAVVSMQIGNRTDNIIQLSLSGGNYSLGIFGGGGVFYNGFTSGTAPTAGDLIFEVECKGANLYVAVDGLVLFNAPVPRFGGAFKPVINRSVNPDQFSFRVDAAWAGQPRKLLQTAADLEVWSPGSSGVFGGAKNHPTSIGVSRIYKPVVDATDFRQVGPGIIHDFTAAGTIAADAVQARLTGGASGTYAVILSAPTRASAGRFLEVEMVATTGGTVTIALTNVDGGSAASTATFSAAGQKLLLVAGATKWTVLKELGVVLT